MAGILQELLQAKEPLFSLAVRQLEQSSRQEGRDVRLIGDIARKMRSNVVELGLDPNDTTGRELYAALQARVAADDTRLAMKFGDSYPTDIGQVSEVVSKIVDGLEVVEDVWVMKRAVAKKLLKNMPPKNLMKHLGHRSIDSMLKHENIDEIYVALRFSEGPNWLDKFNDSLAGLVAGDFEMRKLSVITLNQKYADMAKPFIKKKLHHIVHAKEFGVVAIAPVESGRPNGLVLKTLLLVLHYINEVKLYSTYFKLRQVQPDYGKMVAEMLISDPNNAAEMAGQYVHWRVVQRYFSKQRDKLSEQQQFHPHVQPEDLRWRETEELLTDVDPSFEFWIGQSFVGKMFDGKPLTFNLIDAAFSYADNKAYEDAYFYHFRESLWNELFSRYMGADNIRERVMKQLDRPMIDPQEIMT